jgi:predicted ribosomally synthesized peptide with nif11-like leader
MSVQSAKDFLQRIETNRNLKDRLEAAPNHEARQQLIRSAGFDFSLDEFKQAAAELAAAAGQEWTPAELQRVAGGSGRCACKGPHYNYLRL